MAETRDLEVHLATCAECAGELARYRDLFAAMGSLRYDLVDTPPGFTDAILARVVELDHRLGERIFRVAHDHRVQVAAGAIVGATAIGLIWWRAARRGVARVA
jgi:hypothetical protein